MTKKYINIRLVLILTFFFGVIVAGLWLGLKPNMLKAYYEPSDIVYSSPLGLDPNEYYHDNVMPIISVRSLPNGIGASNCGNDCYHFSGTATSSSAIEFDTHVELKPNTTYTGIVFDQVGTFNGSLYFWDYDYNVSYMGLWLGNVNASNTFTTPSNLKRARLSIYINSGTSINLSFRFMLVEGTSIPNEYHSPFIFGYFLANNSMNNIRSEYIDNYTNTMYTLYNNDTLYLPFQYTNNIVNFNYTVTNINNTGSDVDDVYIYHIPVFKGTLISDLSNNLKSKFIYTYNYMYYSNINITQAIDFCLNNVIQLNYIVNSHDKALVINPSTCAYINVNVITNYTSTLNQSNIIDSSLYFDGTSNSIYSFYLRSHFLFSYQIEYIFSFESIGFGIKNSQTWSSYPVSNSTYDVYNACSAWYDFKCHASNALTYVVYHAPIISPIVSFVQGFVVIISKFIDLIGVFAGLGVVFYIFIMLLFIYILTKFSR